MSIVGESERGRLESLRVYDVLDTPPDDAFDRVTALAARYFDAPIALVSLVDEGRIWFKSKIGLSVDEIPRVPGLCASAILSDDVYVVNNALEDLRTVDNPLVQGDLGVRFYAAAPLITHDGHRLGTVNVIDQVPRDFSAGEAAALQDLAGIVMDQLEIRLAARETAASLTRMLQSADDSMELVTVCAWSKQIKIGSEWVTFEEFLRSTLGMRITHGIHPDVAESVIDGTVTPR